MRNEVITEFWHFTCATLPSRKQKVAPDRFASDGELIRTSCANMCVELPFEMRFPAPYLPSLAFSPTSLRHFFKTAVHALTVATDCSWALLRHFKRWRRCFLITF